MLKTMEVDPSQVSLASLPNDSGDTQQLNVGIIGFGEYGQFLARQMTKKHRVSCMDQLDMVSTLW
jgi:hypothetical protein